MVLPDDWNNMDYSGWAETLGLKDKCQIDTSGNPSRFMQRMAVNEDTTLLLLACELGAYQDGYYAFTLDTKKQRLAPLVLLTPKERDSSWIFTKTNLIWGSVWIEENSAELEVTFLSAATGMCGHRSLYAIATITSNEPVTPLNAYADKDCYNGVRVEAWPQIK